MRFLIQRVRRWGVCTWCVPQAGSACWTGDDVLAAKQFPSSPPDPPPRFKPPENGIGKLNLNSWKLEVSSHVSLRIYVPSLLRLSKLNVSHLFPIFQPFTFSIIYIIMNIMNISFVFLISVWTFEVPKNETLIFDRLTVTFWIICWNHQELWSNDYLQDWNTNKKSKSSNVRRSLYFWPTNWMKVDYLINIWRNWADNKDSISSW